MGKGGTAVMDQEDEIQHLRSVHDGTGLEHLVDSRPSSHDFTLPVMDVSGSGAREICTNITMTSAGYRETCSKRPCGQLLKRSRGLHRQVRGASGNTRGWMHGRRSSGAHDVQIRDVLAPSFAGEAVRLAPRFIVESTLYAVVDEAVCGTQGSPGVLPARIRRRPESIILGTRDSAQQHPLRGRYEKSDDLGRQVCHQDSR